MRAVFTAFRRGRMERRAGDTCQTVPSSPVTSVRKAQEKRLGITQQAVDAVWSCLLLFSEETACNPTEKCVSVMFCALLEVCVMAVLLNKVSKN